VSDKKMRELADMHGQCSLATRAWAADEIECLQASVGKCGVDLGIAKAEIEQLQTTLKNQQHTCDVLAKDKGRLQAELDSKHEWCVNTDLENARLREALEQAEAKIEAQAEYIMTANRVNNNLKKQLEE